MAAQQKRKILTASAEELEFEKEKRLIRSSRKKIQTSRRKKPDRELIEIKKPSLYIKTSNKLFRKASNSLSKKYFNELKTKIKKANIPFMLNSYVSVMLFTTLIVFLAGLILSYIFTIFSFELSVLPFHLSVLPKIFSPAVFFKRFLLFSVCLPALTFILSYYYPSLKISSRKSRIEEELPFAIAHMSAIAGSGVEPSKIFRIIGESPEYKVVGSEIRRVVNKINLYGYDLLTALRETAKTSSDKIRDLLNGMATTIAGGGNLKKYLEKKSHDALTEYKLHRRKQVSVAGTYADIYTGLLIAAPLIFGVILAIMAYPGGELFGLGVETLAIAGLVIIVLLNIAFLIFLNIAQPSE